MMMILFSLDSTFLGQSLMYIILISPAFFILGWDLSSRFVFMQSMSESSGFLLSEKIFVFMTFWGLIGLSGSWLPVQMSPGLIYLLSFSLWGAAVLSWISTDVSGIFSHLVPKDIPYSSLFFMTLIEFFSLCIRPLILGLRLMANILGGHLLVELIWEMLSSTYSVHFMLQFMGLYESFVCFMQSIIFSLLAMNYYNESGEAH